MISSRILAIIPARGGSKGLPRKNIANLGGKPLVAWTIEASLESKYITKTLVSSEDEEILRISNENKADTLERPVDLALDTTTSEAVIDHVIEELEGSGLIFDYIVLLQPTSPLRNAANIDKAFDLLFGGDATALISVCHIDNKILKAFVHDEKGFIHGVTNDVFPFIRRQDLPRTYVSNGAIYIIKAGEFKKNRSLFTDKTISYVMDDVQSLDIDSDEDLSTVSSIVVSM